MTREQKAMLSDSLGVAHLMEQKGMNNTGEYKKIVEIIRNLRNHEK